MAKNASELYDEMHHDIGYYAYTRAVSDPSSPCTEEVTESLFGGSYTLHNIRDNVPSQRCTDVRWAVANVLHFFADTEEAAPLLQYNKHAAKFLTGDKWIGAYGAIAVVQIRECVRLLRSDKHTRRAVVQMGSCLVRDINRPSCWGYMHFMVQRGMLNMLCYQRSLNLHGVMPYDCVLLTNILNYVAWATDNDAGTLYWHVGSLHDKPGAEPRAEAVGASCLLSPTVLHDSEKCWRWLTHPYMADRPYDTILMEGLKT